MSYSYKVYKVCKQLAPIDRNFYMNFKAETTKLAKQIVQLGDKRLGCDNYRSQEKVWAHSSDENSSNTS